VKGLVEFYAHPNGSDGCMSKCKECHKAYVRSWRRETRSERAEYERKRNKLSHRKAQVIEKQRRMRAANPEKYAARTAVGNAVRDGRLAKLPCEVCGSSESQAHHHDYSKPLDVRWLCFKHHREDEHGQVVTAA
jgi:hypothetical protein